MVDLQLGLGGSPNDHLSGFERVLGSQMLSIDDNQACVGFGTPVTDLADDGDNCLSTKAQPAPLSRLCSAGQEQTKPEPANRTVTALTLTR